MHANPWSSACVVAAAKNSACDAVVQLSTTGKVDVRRNATFVFFGLSWVGAGQYYLFNRLYPQLFPTLNSNASFVTVASVTIFDNFVHIPCLYLPIFYATREIAFSHDIPGPRTVEGALTAYRSNFFDDVFMQAGIFVPAQAFNFAVNPPHLRVPFLVGVGVLWVSLLSYFRGDPEH